MAISEENTKLPMQGISEGGRMRLSVRALAIVAGLMWGGAILCLGFIHLANSSYGSSFLEGVSSIYPGFHGARNFGDALVGGVYALIDGAFGGLIFAWLYNLFADPGAHAAR
jgi:hypothetical protein